MNNLTYIKAPYAGIVIVTYNSESVIKECLKSILANNYPNMEVVVVDNASSDKTVSRIRGYFKNIHIIGNKQNVGFGSANNIGIKYLRKKNCDFFLLLNPDTVSSPTLIKKLVNIFQEDDRIGIAGCIITYEKNHKKIWFGGGYFNKLFCFTRHKYMNQSLNSAKVKSGSVDFITGACMMINSKIIKKAGFIPEQYFLYFEDVFFCQKIKEKGFSCYLLAESLISHHVSTSTGIKETNKMTPLRAYFFARNPILYIRENVKGHLKLTNLFGQFFIRLPYYTFQIVRTGDIKALAAYLGGVVDGSFRESSRFFLNNDL